MYIDVFAATASTDSTSLSPQHHDSEDHGALRMGPMINLPDTDNDEPISVESAPTPYDLYSQLTRAVQYGKLLCRSY